jgi:SAM-dependent methyltransferase
MHKEARDFTIFIKAFLGDYFKNKKVLDVGAGDINGNNKYLFQNCEYHGNDVMQANNVTIVSKTKDLPFEENTFDTIISTECFEHDPEYKDSFKKIYKILKPNGLFVFTCASTGRGEHGTRRSDGWSSYGTIAKLEDMQDYYKNLTVEDLNEALELNKLFFQWESYYNNGPMKDLYFVGIKKGDDNQIKQEIPLYEYPDVHKTSQNIK